MVNNHGSRKNKVLKVGDREITYNFFVDNTIMIRDTMKSIVDNFITIGKELKYIKENKVFKLGDYRSFIDYCKTEFGINKTQAYNFINVYERFNEVTYKQYNYSTLVEMLSLTDEQVKKVPAGATAKEVREIKNKEKQKEKENFPDVGKKDNIVLDGQLSIEEINKVSFMELSNQSRLLVAYSVWKGINDILEKQEEPYLVVKELVEYYRKVYLINGATLEEKLKEYPLHPKQP